MRQFYQLYRQGEIALRPILTRWSPPACFYFEVDDRPYLIDITDHKAVATGPAPFTIYFKANYSHDALYPPNVRPCLNGTTLTRRNSPPKIAEREFDLVWLTGIGGGRWHKVAMFKALAALPLKHKLAARLITADDWKWADTLRAAGVEVWSKNVSYRQWLTWNKQARWCVLARGKHDCLSFKLIDYMSIGAAVIIDYPPTTSWPIPPQPGHHFLSLDLSGPDGELTPDAFEALCAEYTTKAQALLPSLQDESVRSSIMTNNQTYFKAHIANGQAARYILSIIEASS
jgi:hypothetical protein